MCGGCGVCTGETRQCTVDLECWFDPNTMRVQGEMTVFVVFFLFFLKKAQHGYETGLPNW